VRPRGRLSDPRLPRPAYFALGLAMIAAIWRLDRLVAGQVSLAVFYLLPVGFVAWFCGGAWAYAVSIISSAAWLQAETASARTYSHWFIPYVNAAMRLILFLVVTAGTILVTRLRGLNDRERELSELKSDMVSLVSHEFGNFLTTFNLSLTILKDTEPGEASETRKHCYATLDRVYAHLTAAVQNFLNLNRIESGRFVPHFRETRLRTLIHTTIAQMGPIIDKKNVALNLDFPARPVPVKADPDALSVIMSNLIGNALKYTPAGGSVTVRIAVEKDAVEVGVEDTGIGISEDDLNQITTGFYRAESGRQSAKGFGVGLKVTRELLESQDARLVIKSEPGRGSQFSFRLPLWNEEKDAAAPPAP
jgi:signal transduction histidine kinase